MNAKTNGTNLGMYLSKVINNTKGENIDKNSNGRIKIKRITKKTRSINLNK